MKGWLTPEAISILLSFLGLGGGGGALFWRTTKRERRIDIAQQIETVSEAMIRTLKQRMDDQESTMAEFRSYIRKDTSWHREVVSELARLNGHVSEPPELPRGV